MYQMLLLSIILHKIDWRYWWNWMIWPLKLHSTWKSQDKLPQMTWVYIINEMSLHGLKGLNVMMEFDHAELWAAEALLDWRTIVVCNERSECCTGKRKLYTGRLSQKNLHKFQESFMVHKQMNQGLSWTLKRYPTHFECIHAANSLLFFRHKFRNLNQNQERWSSLSLKHQEFWYRESFFL